VQTTVAAENCARSLGAADVAPVEVMVTPDPAAKVTCPAPICCMLIVSPIANRLGGTVKVIAAALERVTNLYVASPTTKE
jgi:hypothetical protein